MKTIKNFKYKIVKNFLQKNEIDLLNNYCFIQHKNNRTNFDFIQNNNGDTCFYKDPLMESLMINKLDIMQKETSLELLPTYAFWRMYTKFADLKKHKDRESCEISVTVTIGSDGTLWPIYMDGIEIKMEPGDAVIYLGCEIEHWREEFKGDWQAQVFLHYVDKNGPYTNFKFDGKSYLGQI
jgi:hypothetical protein